MTSVLNYTSKDAIPTIVNGLRMVFLAGKTRSLEYRKNQLKQMYFLVHDNEQAFIDALKKDLGRPKMETVFAEIIGMKNEILTAISGLNKWAKDKTVDAGLPFLMHGTKIRSDPMGTVLVLGAWNYPMTVQLGPMVAAIAAGNTAVLKPSEMSPNTAQLIADLWKKYMDPETSAVINGGIPEVTVLLDQRFEHIFYTGNGRVGRIVAEKAAKWLCSVSLELGGKSPVIIDSSADLNIAAHRTVWAKAFNTGQTCVAPDYVLVERKVQDKFCELLIQAQKEYWTKMDKNVQDFGRIVNENHWKRIMGLIESSKGELVLGGPHEADQASKFIPLTVFKNVRADDSIMSEEIFGPVLPVVPVEDVQEAVRFVNERDQPLALYTFTSKKDVEKYIIQYTRSGSVVSGDLILQYAIDALPFGGTGPSGYGAYHGKSGFDTFSHKRPIVQAPQNGPIGKVVEAVMARRYPPYSEGKINFFRAILTKWALFGRPSNPTVSGTSVNMPIRTVR